MIFGKHQRDIRLEGRMTPDQSMAADFRRFSTVLFLQLRYPYPLKNGIGGGGVVLKFHFKILFLQSCFLND